MIRGKVISLLLLATFLLCAFSNQFEKIHLSNVERTVNLAGQYPTEIAKLTLHANEDEISHFSYLVLLEFDSKISRLFFVRSGKDKNSLGYTRSVYIYNGGSFAHYRVKLPYNLNIGDTVQITVQIVFLDRYVNLPKSITLAEDQRLQYEDTKFIVSPYQAKIQRTTYKFSRVIQYDQDGEKKGLTEVLFTKSNVPAFSFTRHRVFGVNNNPQVKFTEVEKVVEVSHWGNVAITQNYKIVNTGPSLKGEFSRVTYGSKSQSQAKNAYKGLEFDLPYQIWGLYYRDQVGNITTSHAWRDESARAVHVSLSPRFSLLGGWKSNWQVGYNFKTEGLLFNSGNKFELKNIKLEYAMERIITEQFRIKIVLPHGAENVKIRIGGNDYDMSLVQVTSQEGYLDFEGRPTYVIDHFSGAIRDKHLEVYYDFPLNNIYGKPLRLFATILGFLLFTIFVKRFTLKAFEQKTQ